MPKQHRPSPKFVQATEPDEATGLFELATADRDLVEKIRAQALIDAGYCREEEGLARADEKQLQMATLQRMLGDHVVESSKQLKARAVTKFELYAELLPTAPGIESVAETVEEYEAQVELMRNLWTYSNPGVSGFVQKHIASSGYVLCEAKVARTKVNEETGRREPITEMGRFLTADRELILTYYTAPAGAAFLRAARKLDNMLGMVTARQPELAMPVARQLGVVVKQAVASVPHADVKQAQALTTGRGNSASEDSA